MREEEKAEIALEGENASTDNLQTEENADENCANMDISFLVNDSFSTIDTSVMMHDYCGSIDSTHISTLRNQET